MSVLITENPEMGSCTASLLEAYKKKGHTVVCSFHNFFSSNFIPDIVHVQRVEKLCGWHPLSEKSEKIKIDIVEQRLQWYKTNGAVIVYSIYNVIPQNSDNHHFEERLSNLLIKNADIITHYCSKSEEIIKKLYPEACSKINIINPHGDFLIYYSDQRKESAREKLKIPMDSFVILNLRHCQTYKKEKFIKSVFNSCRIKSKYLLIAGNYNYSGLPYLKKYYLKLKNHLRKRNTFTNKKYIYRTINKSEMTLLFCSSDIVLLGYEEGMISEIIAMAATFAKPVIYPEIACFKEQLGNWPSLGYEKGNILQACKAVTDMYYELKNDNVNLDNERWLDENSWDVYVKKILDVAEKSRFGKNI